MNMTRAWLVGAVGLAAGAALVAADTGPSGYLKPGAFDILQVLPPAPREGDPRYAADRAIFAQTRALKGTPRWAMATNDVKTSPADMLRDFSCPLGIVLTPETAPRTLALLARAGIDTGKSSGIAKSFYKRLRPFQIDKGAICQPAIELAGSYDYPSGHTTWGWTVATLLAQIAPDRATPILARGRAFGQSRVVCGVHNASAVDAGYMTAAATIDAMAGEPAFQADVAAAKAEIAALRANAATPHPDAGVCTADAGLVAQRVY